MRSKELSGDRALIYPKPLIKLQFSQIQDLAEVLSLIISGY